jgi:Cys-tRNA(Pro)/Cys-tRNA(Cys) deacylase
VAAGIPRTNAARRLEARGVPHEVRVYDPAQAFHSADEAASLLGVPAGSVFKTLVVLREGPGRAKPLLVLVPSDRQLDLGRLGRAVGDKRIRLATRQEAEGLTGLRVGGISALAVRPAAFEVLLDGSALRWGRIHVSAGVRGVDLALAPADFLAATGGRPVDLGGEADAEPGGHQPIA